MYFSVLHGILFDVFLVFLIILAYFIFYFCLSMGLKWNQVDHTPVIYWPFVKALDDRW
jgi:hypothetical protein